KSSSLEPLHYKAKLYSYKYHSGYGSPQINKQTLTPRKVSLSEDGKEVLLQFDDMVAKRVYEFDLQNLRTQEGSKLLNTLVAYHAHNLAE
ncbi:MAG: hypothetical protein VX371_07845, partial [Verrucomicrobiota bacterium]|nr:hypothetical protein [Verrucomicrobiota bacterium]